MKHARKSTAQKRTARRLGEFERLVRRNLRLAHRVLERAEQVAQRCYGKAGAAMLEAKIFSAMSEDGFTAWLAPFELSQDRLGQCLELGRVTLDRRGVDAAEREESFKRMVEEKIGSNEPRNLAGS